MKINHIISSLIGLTMLGTGLGSCLVSCSGEWHADKTVDRAPELWPDYAGVTMPVNIAAPGFRVVDEAEDYQMAIGRRGEEPRMILTDSRGRFSPDLDRWHRLLAEASGDSIYMRLTTKGTDGISRWKDITIAVSPDSIDGWLAYRLIYPGYALWNKMGIYQRELSTYRQVPIIENKDIERQCVNCHSSVNRDPSTIMFHVRGPQGGTAIVRNGEVTKVKPKCPELANGSVYPRWHPSGRFIAFSSNDIKQFFHSGGMKPIEVTDLASDLTVYDVERDVTVTSPTVSGDEWMETFPEWTPDGKTIYFCRAKKSEGTAHLDSIHYDLCRVDFDIDSMQFGKPEIVYEASREGLSVSFPRISPDGRWLVFTRSDYGNFSIWHPESQLCLLDLATGDLRELEEINSDSVDSYHTWSSDGRWLVFSSKRLDGLWARPMFARFDPSTARFAKPFVLPQKSDDFYDNMTRSYNIPEFLIGPVTAPRDMSAFMPDKQPSK